MIIYIDSISTPTKIKSFTDDGIFLVEKVLDADKSQTEKLLLEINGLVEEGDDLIKGIYVNIAPGSYTSSRVGITVANFLGFSLNLQPVGIESEAKLGFKKGKKFNRPILPVYRNNPVITDKKE